MLMKIKRKFGGNTDGRIQIVGRLTSLPSQRRVLVWIGRTVHERN